MGAAPRRQGFVYLDQEGSRLRGQSEAAVGIGVHVVADAEVAEVEQPHGDRAGAVLAHALGAEGSTLVFCFLGKSGVERTVTIDDPATVEALEVMRRRRGPGDQELLAWKERGRWQALGSGHVNDYVRRATGMEATAKDFRTWHATVIAAAALAATDEPGQTRASRKRAEVAAMKEVAEFLGNTPALARSSYVDPRVVDAYEEGRTIAPAVRRKAASPAERQPILERAVLRLLKT